MTPDDALGAKRRRGVLTLLILLCAITYLDRVCISVAGPSMQEDLQISPAAWGWVTGMFMLAYGLFEIPSGALGDRIGARHMLTRIVLWWSAFTVLTGAASNFYLLLLTRFCFGAGEAGAYPNSAIVVSRWFPARQRATISGVTLMAGQLGGALAPLLIIPIQMRYGWRASFYVFGALGVFWALAWYLWFRDSPGKEPAPEARATGFPWRSALRSRTVLALALATFCNCYAYTFFQTWLHTFLVKGRGFTDEGLLLSALPFALAACATLGGGFASDALVRRFGFKWGRRSLGITALSLAALLTAAALVSQQPMATLILLSLVYGAITFQQAGVLGVCLDLSGGRHAGTMLGFINTTAQLGGLLGSVAFGYIVEHFGNYDAPLVPMTVLLFVSALLWTQIDASEPISERASSPPVTASTSPAR